MVDHKAGDAHVDETSQTKGGSDRAVQEGNAGKADLVKQQQQHTDQLKAGGRSGITCEFGKPVLFDSTDGKALSEMVMQADHSLDAHVKPNETVTAFDGGQLHADGQGRIDRITDTNGKVTVVRYDGESKYPSKIVTPDGGIILTKQGEHYVSNDQSGTLQVSLDQESGIISWTNSHDVNTRRFPSGGIVNEDANHRVRDIVDAKGVATHCEWGNGPLPIKITREGVDYQLAGDPKKPEYVVLGGPAEEPKRYLAAVDKRTGQFCTISEPDNLDIESYQELNTLVLHRIDGTVDSLDGDPNPIPEPLRKFIDLAHAAGE
jgi:uncharacterized protein YdeI (BOF family)